MILAESESLSFRLVKSFTFLHFGFFEKALFPGISIEKSLYWLLHDAVLLGLRSNVFIHDGWSNGNLDPTAQHHGVVNIHCQVLVEVSFPVISREKSLYWLLHDAVLLALRSYVYIYDGWRNRNLEPTAQHHEVVNIHCQVKITGKPRRAHWTATHWASRLLVLLHY